VLGVGCDQEEIHFVLYPELIAARLFTECLELNECLVVAGVEHCNDSIGYRNTFRFKESHKDTVPRFVRVSQV
jgi:poly(ADP-ribose) glycohydrolase